MSIYKIMLGEDFNRLQPKLQTRYDIKAGVPFRAEGMMKKIVTGPKWLAPFLLFSTKWKFLFPEHGEHIPFQIINTVHRDEKGNHQVYWERTFHFKNKNRYFNALMSLDSEHRIVKDYLGEPSLFYSELVFDVTEQGHMHIHSKKQRLVLGKVEIPIPAFFLGNVSVTESFLEENGVFSIHVHITNPLIGTLFEYEGEFYSNEN